MAPLSVGPEGRRRDPQEQEARRCSRSLCGLEVSGTGWPGRGPKSVLATQVPRPHHLSRSREVCSQALQCHKPTVRKRRLLGWQGLWGAP